PLPTEFGFTRIRQQMIGRSRINPTSAGEGAGVRGARSLDSHRSPHPTRVDLFPPGRGEEKTMTLALPAQPARRLVRFDMSWPILGLVAAVLVVLIVLPMSWLGYVAF